LQARFTDDKPLRHHRDLVRAEKKMAIDFGHALERIGNPLSTIFG
jgi:hypothetical protein